MRLCGGALRLTGWIPETILVRTKHTSIFLIVALLAVAVLSSQPLTAGAAGIPDHRFGVVEAYAAPAAANSLGAGWERVTFEWSRIQPNGPDEWNVLPLSDRALAGELAQGRQVVGLLITMPAWAIDPGTGLPQGLHLPIDDPGNLWANFVRTIVSRYAGRVDHWVVWNEPEIPQGSPDATWPGSIPDFLQLLRVAYFVSKGTNPNAVVHLAAISHYHDPDWFNRFLDTLVADPGAAANSYYFDIASLNLYHEPEKIYDITAHYVRMLHGKGVHKPLWITETNAYLSRVSLEQQAIFMVQAFSLQIAAGASRIAVYKMIDTETDQAADPEPFGLVRADGSRRPAFTAYRTAATHLSGFRGGSFERRDNVAVVVIDRGSRTTTVVWARTPEGQLAEIPARSTRALAVDVWGSARYIYPQGGYYVIQLGGADCSEGCVLGGPPTMLVEDAPSGSDAPPPAASPTRPAAADTSGSPQSTASPTRQTSTRIPFPTRRATPTHYPTWTRTPTPTPEATATELPSATPTRTPGPTNTPAPTAIPLPTPTLSPEPQPQRRTAGTVWIAAAAAALVAGSTAVVVGLRRRRRAGRAR